MGMMLSPDKQIDNLQFHAMPTRPVNVTKAVRCGNTIICVDAAGKLYTDSKLVGNRDALTANRFLRKVRGAVADCRYQVTTDGLSTYRYAVPFQLGSNIDYAMLIKQYAATQEQTRYSPATIISIEKVAIFGEPDMDSVCTSHIERLNLTLRMQLRRFTRLTNGHSKSLSHHTAMQGIFFAWYNFCRKHETLKTTPAVASGLTERPMTLLQLLQAAA